MLFMLFSPQRHYTHFLIIAKKIHKNIFFKKQELGFTLIEIMVALVILAGLTVLALPRINSNTNELKSTIRKLTVLGKQLQVHSRLEHKTFRLAFHLHDKKAHSFWVESASGYVSESAEDENEDNNEEDQEEDTKAPRLNTFEIDTRMLREPVSLPKPLVFTDIEVENDISKKGKVYVHFFPQGVIEEAAIHISSGNKGDKSGWTITYNSLTGKGHIINKYISLENLRERQ